MTDEPIGSLTPVAAFATTQEFAVNDSGTTKKLSGAQLIATLAEGTLGYAEVTVNQTGVTTVADLTGLTVTVTVGAGRRIRITANCLLANSSAGGTNAVFIVDTAGPTNVGKGLTVSPAANNQMTTFAMAVLTPTAGSHTYKLQASNNGGAGTLTLQASVTACFILVEDIGT